MRFIYLVLVMVAAMYVNRYTALVGVCIGLGYIIGYHYGGEDEWKD